MMYGGFTSNVDMSRGTCLRHTGITRGEHGGRSARALRVSLSLLQCSASNVVDAQAAYESEMSLWGAVMGRANLVFHAAGWMEGGLVASFEKMVIDAEMIQSMVEFLQPLDTSEDALGFEAMKEVGPGGHFFGAAHTLARYETAFYSPLVSDWRNYETWRLAGAQDTAQRATETWQRALQEYEQPAIEPAVREEPRAYVARRRDEIGAGEP